MDPSHKNHMTLIQVRHGRLLGHLLKWLLAILKVLALVLISAAIFNLLVALRGLRTAEAERDLQALEEWLRFTDFSIENLSDAVYWTTMHHRIVKKSAH
jgi:hypothetical protein